MTITIIKKPIKSLRMKITAHGDILVSAPKSMSDKAIQSRIDSKDERIRTSLAKIQTKRPKLPANQMFLLGEIYLVTLNSTTNSVQVDVDQKQIFTPDKTTLDQFIRSLAKTYLTKKITQRAETHGLTYNKLFIRSQKTKRGTCSSQKHISLNRKLITLPDRIIDYVICHELAHLNHMNHSKQFRDHCTALFPKTKEAKQWMKHEGFMIE